MLEHNLEGKVALVTAAAQGIGKASAELLARNGATVWATDINAAALDQVSGCETMPMDILDPTSVAEALMAIGTVDVLFNCAGFVAAGTILDCNEEDWALSFDLNVTGMYRLIRQVLPSMLERGSGNIINMSSILGANKGAPNRFAYGASKAAVVGMTKSIAIDFVKQGIRCNAIAPGTVDTPSLHERLHATGNYEQALKEFNARQAMGRIGKANEIAALALYLAGDASSFTTGQCFVIDGGWSL